MAWVALVATLVLFSAVLIAFLWALFFVQNAEIAKTALASTDATLGWALKTVFAYLFPAPAKEPK